LIHPPRIGLCAVAVFCTSRYITLRHWKSEAANRAPFLLEIIEEVSAAIGSDRLCVRVSPFGQYGGIRDSEPKGRRK
jgi:NADH:flavin oxidoreductase/NADH oxidase family protein